MKYSGLVVASLSLLAMSCGTVLAQPHDDGRPDGPSAAAPHDNDSCFVSLTET
jgi:hypothetical protein